CSPSEMEELREGEVKLPGSCEAGEPQHPSQQEKADFIKDHSKANGLPMKSKKASSFHEFACNTRLLFLLFFFTNLNSKVAKAMAARVLENHSNLWAKPEWAQSALRDVPTNCKVIKSSSKAQLSRTACVWTPLQKQQSLPLRPVILLVARISDQNASGAPPMTLREKTHPEKFRQLLSSHSTDLDELRKCSWPGVPREVRPVMWHLSVSTRTCDTGVLGDCAKPGTCAARPSLCPVTRFAHFVSLPSLRVSCRVFFGWGV
uniref:Uncharacterized protein n=1 Tax=Bubo bubo TaxID=30461 RepID=A0A8C0EJD1_BUBBB